MLVAAEHAAASVALLLGSVADVARVGACSTRTLRVFQRGLHVQREVERVAICIVEAARIAAIFMPETTKLPNCSTENAMVALTFFRVSYQFCKLRHCHCLEAATSSAEDLEDRENITVARGLARDCLAACKKTREGSQDLRQETMISGSGRLLRARSSQQLVERPRRLRSLRSLLCLLRRVQLPGADGAAGASARTAEALVEF
mmetsp:Transcript_78081/g.140878  ORF Transcript_78081/g.140878 Transcript_78081/m.140878 type:complete len:204 (-) Transcript_78081:571-1182(-)